MLKGVWKGLGSPGLTVVLTVLICVDTAVGSFVVAGNRAFYERLDMEILFPYLWRVVPEHPWLTLWIVVLVVLVSLFAVNTLVCIIDRVYMILKKRAPLRALLPQLVHVGFIVALLGHLAGSTYGFRAYGTVAIEGQKLAVPHTEDLYMRLDGVHARFSHTGELTDLKVSITLFEGDIPVYSDEMSINDPLIYRGIAFYYVRHGRTLRGFLIDVDGKKTEVSARGSFASPRGRIFYFGRIHTEGTAVPLVEVIADSGRSALLRLAPSSAIELEGSTITLVDFVLASYGVFTINRDPGIWPVGVGSVLLVGGMLGLLFAREDRGELVS